MEASVRAGIVGAGRREAWCRRRRQVELGHREHTCCASWSFSFTSIAYPVRRDSLTQWGCGLRQKWVNDRRTRAGFQTTGFLNSIFFILLFLRSSKNTETANFQTVGSMSRGTHGYPETFNRLVGSNMAPWYYYLINILKNEDTAVPRHCRTQTAFVFFEIMYFL